MAFIASKPTTSWARWEAFMPATQEEEVTGTPSMASAMYRPTQDEHACRTSIQIAAKLEIFHILRGPRNIIPTTRCRWPWYEHAEMPTTRHQRCATYDKYLIHSMLLQLMYKGCFGILSLDDSFLFSLDALDARPTNGAYAIMRSTHADTFPCLINNSSQSIVYAKRVAIIIIIVKCKYN